MQPFWACLWKLVPLACSSEYKWKDSLLGLLSGKHSYHLINSYPFFCRWFNVDEDATSISDGNHNYMGRTCRKSLFPLLDRRESENSSYDVSVRHHYTHQDEQECQHSEDQDKSLYKPCVIFRMRAAPHPKWSMTLESQNLSSKPMLNEGMTMITAIK